MRIVIPMAGWGSRLRPHTLTVPKPMVTIAGKPIVQRLCEGLMKTIDEPVESIHFIIREEFGQAIEDKLMQVAKDLGTQGEIAYQKTPEGTAHAIYCAKEALDGPVIVAFADTLFQTDFTISASDEGVIWVSRVEDPSAFGVVKLSDDETITDFVEKPETFVSDLAIIGIYYFQKGEELHNEIKHLIDNNIRGKGGEFQLTDALENLKNKGTKFKPGKVTEWLDCGNKNAVVYTNQRVLANGAGNQGNRKDVTLENSVVIEPCYIGPGVTLQNTVVGPSVSIEENSCLTNVVVQNSLIQAETTVENYVLKDSMVGGKCKLHQAPENLSVGDYTVTE